MKIFLKIFILVITTFTFTGVVFSAPSNFSNTSDKNLQTVVPKEKVPTEFLYVFSDESDIISNDNNAVKTWVDERWVIPSWEGTQGSWIWNSYLVSPESANNGERETFTKNFNIDNDIISAYIEYSSDNGYILEINDRVVLNNIDEVNPFSQLHKIDVVDYLIKGDNTLKFTVRNRSSNGCEGHSQCNPAGLIYRLVVEKKKNDIPYINLTASPTTPTRAYRGVPSFFSAFISNEGDVSVEKPFPYFFQIREITSVGDNIYDYPSNTLEGLTKNSKKEVYFNHTFNHSSDYFEGLKGRLLMRVCADKINRNTTAENDSVNESDETDNCSPWVEISLLDYSGETEGSIDGYDCYILSGNSCKVSVLWSTTNPIFVPAVTTPTNITVATGDYGRAQYSMEEGTRTFFLYHNGVLLDQIDLKAIKSIPPNPNPEPDPKPNPNPNPEPDPKPNPNPNPIKIPIFKEI